MNNFKIARGIFLICIISTFITFFVVLGHSIGMFSGNKTKQICENMSGKYVDNWLSNNMDGCYFLNGTNVVIIKKENLIGAK